MHVLCLNAGSSSLKAATFEASGDGRPVRVRSVLVERVGTAAASLVVTDDHDDHEPVELGPVDHVGALGAVVSALQRHRSDPIDAVAHRVVHGGPNLQDHAVIDVSVRAALDAAVPLAPLHLPAELELVDAATAHYPDRPEIACLDTAFHRDLLDATRRLPIPAELDQAGVRRYGFHGLSYEYLVAELGTRLGSAAVLAHLGNGASMAAVRDGVGVDTTMGFTPTGGLVMGTRSGDLDPGVLVHAARVAGLDADGLEDLVDHRCGLVGLSGGTSDVRDLVEARRSGDERAVLALAVYELVAAKHLAAMTVALGGLDTLVFTAGVGQHAPEVRAGIIRRLGHLGLTLDATGNEADAPVISQPGADVTIRVVATDEESVMARHAARLTGG